MNFDSMFKLIHGYPPFPWQSRAAETLVAGRPLNAVNVPTASGKTAMIDAALYAAANGGPKRIAFIINRRVVVDEAYERALIIAVAMNQPQLSALANKLGNIQVVRLRGGVHGDDDWVLYPDKVTIIVSTVDQVGSRLLHRGYGVGSRMAPMHAGFMGNGITYIVDEAHLSTPFVETVETACNYGADIQLIKMTATPSGDDQHVISLNPDDINTVVLRNRLEASKQAKLLSCSSKESEFVKTVVDAASEMNESDGVIGIVVNRVNSARFIHQALLRQKRRSELLTGRIRPHDRDVLMKRLLPEIKTGRARNSSSSPLFVVATQTIEVGADLDFDALITEAASLDALRQRFGRLDRLGKIGKTWGWIIYRPKIDKQNVAQPDPIYGMGTTETWEWLQAVSTDGYVDFGISAIKRYMQKMDPPVIKTINAPALLPAHLSLLYQTGPLAPYIDVSPWLHGAQTGSADVSVIWRADLKVDDSDKWAETVQLRPPLNRESLELPIYALRSWLESGQTAEIADLEGVEGVSEGRTRTSSKVLRWRGPDECQVITSREIRPGDTLLLPVDYGGCDEYGWQPGSEKPATDIADLCSLEGHGDHIVRLVPGLTGWLGQCEKDAIEVVREYLEAETTIDPELGVDYERLEAAENSLRSIVENIDHPLFNALGDNYQVERHPLGVVLRGRTVDEVNATLNAGVRVELEQHLEGVAKMAACLAENHPEKGSIICAATQHDKGKAEPRFQAMLHGNPVSAASGPLLAKSGLKKLSQIRASYVQSGIPKGFRHELASIEYTDNPEGRGENFLVQYLIGTHHGYGRPWFPNCSDENSPGAGYIPPGNPLMKNFVMLIQEYNPWQLAGMELLLRASDARQSIAERQGDGND